MNSVMNRQIIGVVIFMMFLVLAPLSHAHRHASRTLVHIRSGLVRGVIEGNLRAFRGLPYAAPPVGELRWRSPEPPVGWAGIRDASSFGPLCPQITAAGNLTGNEDCLTLNIYTAADQPA